MMKTCSFCLGSGKVSHYGWGGTMEIIKCWKCDGLGAEIDDEGLKKCFINLLERIDILERKIERK